ncbi:MAG: thiaminase II [Bradymonadaceae bacterium]
MLDERPFDVTPFAQTCLEAAERAWRGSFEHPFVRALVDGELDAERFAFYQKQDARYLEAFADAACLLSTQCHRPDDSLWFVEAAQIALVTEAELHEGYGEQLGYTREDIAELELTPNNRAYQNHMISTIQRDSLLVGTAALTPCPWLYIDLGVHFENELGTIPDDHPYAEWLKMYSDPQFHEFVDTMLAKLQRFAEPASEEERERAVEAFRTSARYEWMFWQQAWEPQSWPTERLD